MTYEELVSEIKNVLSEKIVSDTKEHCAIEIDIRGEAEGAFYVELSEGKINIAPYEYYDRDILVTTTASVILSILNGYTTMQEAYRFGMLHARGNLQKASAFSELFD